MTIIGSIFLGIIGALANRIRGGWLKEEWFDGSTQYVRFVWTICFSLVLFFGLYDVKTIEYQEIGWLKLPIIGVFAFLSWALLGSGAHSVMHFKEWQEQWSKGNHPDDTEFYTQYVLPWIFKGKPDISWSEDEFLLYHITGKSLEGLLRNTICMFPIAYLDISAAMVYIFSGLLWGFIWYGAHLLPTWFTGLSAWNKGEILIGFMSFFLLGMLFY